MKRQIDKIYFTIEQIQEKKQLIRNEYEQIRALENKIAHHKKQIEAIQQVLIDNCNHNKVQDRCCYEHTTYHCDICDQDLW